MFKEIGSRERAIDNAHGGTCAWLLKTDQYTAWVKQPLTEWDHGLLWIKGYAGAGKSTMMKFAVDRARHASKDELILPHFFNARGTALEHSSEGMYRTLLVWLLDALPEGFGSSLNAQNDDEASKTWQIPELVRLLKAALRELSDQPVVFYIDALDECGEAEVRAMIKVFRDLVRDAWSTGRRVRVCFASRPYPLITFKDALFLDFSEQKEHIQDIARYIDDELEIGNSALAQRIRVDVRKKAAGSFMWTVLVVRVLNKEHDRGRMHSLGQRLQEIPQGLHELYSHILERYPEDRDAMLACCRLLLFAARSLSVAELWWATQWMLLHDQTAINDAYAGMSAEDLERYIVDMSKGFIEFREVGELRRAQFLHESVRDYILDRNQLARLYGTGDRKGFDGQSHEILRNCCADTLEADRPRIQTMIRTYKNLYSYVRAIDFEGEDSNKDQANPVPPFAPYAAKYVMDHAEEAQRLGYDQTAFLSTFTDRCGPHFLSPTRLASESINICSAPISLLLEKDCGALIRATQAGPARHARQRGHAFGLVKDNPNSQRLEWLGSASSVKALVDLYLGLEDRHPVLQQILQSLVAELYVEEVDVRWGNKPPLLKLAQENPPLSTFFLLSLAPAGALEPHLDSLKHIVNMQSSGHRSLTPGWYAQYEMFLRTFHFFIEKDIPSDAVNFGNAKLRSYIEERTYWHGSKVEMAGAVAVLAKIKALI